MKLYKIDENQPGFHQSNKNSDERRSDDSSTLDSETNSFTPDDKPKDSEEKTFSRKFSTDDEFTYEQLENCRKIHHIKLRDIKVNPLNAEIYNDNSEERKIELEALKDSIKLNGLLEPILLDHNNTIISGHRRFEAAKQLKRKSINCLYGYVKEGDEKLALVDANIRRNQKTWVEKAEELKIKKDEIAQGRGKRNDLIQAQPHDTRKMLSQQFGISETYISYLIKLIESNRELLHRVDKGELSLRKAYTQCLLRESANCEVDGNAKDIEPLVLSKVEKLSQEDIHSKLSNFEEEWNMSVHLPENSLEEKSSSTDASADYLKKFDPGQKDFINSAAATLINFVIQKQKRQKSNTTVNIKNQFDQILTQILIENKQIKEIKNDNS